ncbi:MAG: hypothetical protein AAFZ15_33920 [Bacteroidota bacterium]
MFFRKISFIDESIFSRVSNRDRALINILALFVPLSSLIAGFAFFFGVMFILGSKFLGIVVGFLITFALYHHDRTLLDTYSMEKIIGRVIFSILIALIMAIPYKVNLSQNSITQKIEQEVEEFNNVIDAELLAEEKIIFQQEEELNSKVTEAGEYYDRTGKSQRLIEARRERDAFLEKKELVLESLRDTYSSRKREADISNTALAGYYLKNMFSTSSPTELFINLFVFALLLCMESMPAIMRILLNNGEYIRIKEHLEKISKRADEKIWSIDEKLLSENGISNLPELLGTREVWKIMKSESKNDFSNSEELIALLQKANLLKKQPVLQKVQQEEEFPNFEYEG